MTEMQSLLCNSRNQMEVLALVLDLQLRNQATLAGLEAATRHFAIKSGVPAEDWERVFHDNFEREKASASAAAQQRLQKIGRSLAE